MDISSNLLQKPTPTIFILIGNDDNGDNRDIFVAILDASNEYCVSNGVFE